jgi:CoA:oxalate CoA-transferase
MDQQQSNLLAGIRVLDLTRVMSGPFCTAMLSDLGAEVIKLEECGTGDVSRSVTPHIDGESTYFMLLNRGKKSVEIDLKSDAGRQVVLDLARHSDVLIENFRPGVMERLGLSYEEVAKINSRLVYVSVSGFGQTGELSRLPAYDLVVQAMSGLMSLTGEKEGRALAVGESLADVCTGVFAAFGTMAALFGREKSRKGCHVDVAMLDCMCSMLVTALSRALFGFEHPRARGNRHPTTYPVDSFPTLTGDIVLVCFGDTAFRDLVAAIGRPALADDPRFRSNADRSRHDVELADIIGSWSRQRSRENVLSALREHGLPCAPVWSLSELLATGHLQARGMIAAGTVASLGEVPIVTQPVKFSTQQNPSRASIPRLGQHNEEILSVAPAWRDGGSRA